MKLTSLILLTALLTGVPMRSSFTVSVHPFTALTPTNPLFDFEKQAGFVLPAYSPRDEVIVHDGYTLRFRDEYKVADWVAYPLLAEEINGQTVREGSTFKPDPAVPTGSALPGDYTKSGYDRGHQAPAGDFHFSRSMMDQTFLMSNMSPQLPAFNRGIWKKVEELVRGWAIRDGGLYVVTGAVLKPGLLTIGSRQPIAVPEQFYKVILYCEKPNIRMIGFVLRNEGSSQALPSFVVSVDEIEKLTGIDFFPLLPTDLKRRLKAAPPGETVPAWFF